MDVFLRSDGTMGFTDFSPAEALRMAVRLERDGIDFYSRCLELFHDRLFTVGFKKLPCRPFEQFLFIIECKIHFSFLSTSG